MSITLLEVLPDSKSQCSCFVVDYKCQEGERVEWFTREQSQELRWCHLYRGRGWGVVWRRDEDKFSKWKEEGLTIWPSHHTMLVGEGCAKRFTAEGNFSELWMSHSAADALIHVSDPAQCSNTSYPRSLLSAARLVHLLHVHSHTHIHSWSHSIDLYTDWSTMLPKKTLDQHKARLRENKEKIVRNKEITLLMPYFDNSWITMQSCLFVGHQGRQV